MEKISELKAAINAVAERKEAKVKAWFVAKKAEYESEDAFYADPYSSLGVNEINKLREASEEYAKEHGLSDEDAQFIFVLLHSAWNDVLAWAKP